MICTAAGPNAFPYGPIPRNGYKRWYSCRYFWNIFENKDLETTDHVPFQYPVPRLPPEPVVGTSIAQGPQLPPVIFREGKELMEHIIEFMYFGQLQMLEDQEGAFSGEQYDHLTRLLTWCALLTFYQNSVSVCALFSRKERRQRHSGLHAAAPVVNRTVVHANTRPFLFPACSAPLVGFGGGGSVCVCYSQMRPVIGRGSVLGVQEPRAGSRGAECAPAGTHAAVPANGHPGGAAA